MSEIFVEPFCGEFGYELFGWQSILRKMARKYDKMHVWCRPGHGILYKDFAEVNYFDPKSVETNCHKRQGGIPFERLYDGNWLTVEDVYVNGWKSLFDGSLQHEFIEFGYPISPAYTLIHARNTNKFNTGHRNWPLENWNKLVPHLTGFIASIGSVADSVHIPGTTDLRGLTLQTTCLYMAGANVVIGPSSGPIHLASLCGCPHLTWTAEKRIIKRYETDWNPFEIKCYVHEDGQPHPNTIIDLLRGFDATLVCS